ncbi:MAG TPA: multicopper oxidase domain-containing protein [Candidatus Eisenbacteria bacterium]|nr:multicopper oxidase domain-containing protein [Candidatus Eisenbacteria bacterium]
MTRRLPARPRRGAFATLAASAALLAFAAGCGGGSAAGGAAAEADTLASAARDHAIRSLSEFDTGKVTTLPDGRTLREYWVSAIEKSVEVAPGVRFPAWTFNGAIPGPSLRCTEGDSLRIYFKNEGSMSHSMHFHGIHAANMDGVFEQVPAGSDFVYAFNAEPFGLHLYHCHTMPVKMHIGRGLYGVFLIDPKKPRPPAREMVMMMNGFDTDLNGEDNEIYTVNGYANVYFRDYPIPVKAGELQRIYLVNITEIDLLNSLHTHATFFHVYPTGTSRTPSHYTDVINLGQAERAILEFKYDLPGRYLFHAHQNEFAELGWLGQFEVKR